MSFPRNIAVILSRHDTSQIAPSIANVRSYFADHDSSLARFWSDGSYGWITYPRFDFFGWYDVTLPPPGGPGADRGATAKIAKDAAAAAGVDLSLYNGFVILQFPGSAMVVNAQTGRQELRGYDGGAIGSTAVINAHDNQSFLAHEFGHVLGFGHTYGLLTTGADWSDNGVDDLSPEYGDPYDIMSAQTFGGSDPKTLLNGPNIPEMPNAWLGGPMVSRALLHYQMPMALESAGKVTHVWEHTGNNPIVHLDAAGSDGTHPQLLVYHPTDEAPNGIGRVYVEYRQGNRWVYGTRWDRGLADSGTARDRAGIIIHVVRPAPESTTPVVWYVGRITLPTPDLDVALDPPAAGVLISVAAMDANQRNPLGVSVQVSRTQVQGLSLLVESTETRRVITTESRTHPNWPFMTFVWERREVTRSTRFRPLVKGLGGGGAVEGAEPVTIQWRVNGQLLTGVAPRVISIHSSTLGRPIAIDYTIDQGTKELTLTNRPQDGAYSVPVVCRATDSTSGAFELAASTYTAREIEEGWGDGFYQFLDWWHRLTHPIPREIPGPPTWWLQERFNWAIERINVIEEFNPGVAESLHGIVQELESLPIQLSVTAAGLENQVRNARASVQLDREVNHRRVRTPLMGGRVGNALASDWGTDREEQS